MEESVLPWVVLLSCPLLEEICPRFLLIHTLVPAAFLHIYSSDGIFTVSGGYLHFGGDPGLWFHFHHHLCTSGAHSWQSLFQSISFHFISTTALRRSACSDGNSTSHGQHLSHKYTNSSKC